MAANSLNSPNTDDYPPLDGTPEEKIKAWLTPAKNSDGHSKAGDWMDSLIPHLTLVSTSPSLPHPSVTICYTVQDDHCNRLRNLHGGCAATLFDFCTSMPLVLVSKPGFWQYMGVSRTLNVTYFRPVPAGVEVLIECEILQVGKKLCGLRGTMRRKSDNAIMCIAEHQKFNIDPEHKL